MAVLERPTRVRPIKGRRMFARVVAIASAHAGLVAAAGLALALASVWFVLTHFSITTNEDDLLSPKLAFREREAAFSRQFPSLNSQIVVVIDAVTPELAEEAAASLSDTLSARPELFPQVRRPNGGPFWAREGLLYASTADVKSSTSRLISAEPFLGPIAADPSLRGLMNALSTAVQGVAAGQTTFAPLQQPMARLITALTTLESGKNAVFSWRSLIGGGSDQPSRQILLIEPKLDYNQLEPGSRATNAIRLAARRLDLDPGHGVTVRVTGTVPLQDEEFGSLSDRAAPIAIAAVSAIVLMLWLAVRSPKLIAAILATTVTGLVTAAALGLVIFHEFNVISIAFIPLFVGLGIDFGIQLSVRFRADHAPGTDVRQALTQAAEEMGAPIALAAIAIASGFLSFVPTSYIGVSQLGMIAGAGMIIALALNLTLLPALVCLLKPNPSQAGEPPPQISRLDDFVLANRRKVLAGFLVTAAVCLFLLPFVRFDFNPLHMRDPHTESMSTLNELMQDPQYAPAIYTLEALQPGLPAAEAQAARLQKLPEVASAQTLADFVPADQAAKLASITDANNLLSLTLNPVIVAPPPTDSDVVKSLVSTADALTAAARGADAPSAQARKLAAALRLLAEGTPQMRARASAALMTPFATTLGQIQNALTAEPVTLESLPSDLVRDWISSNGEARISISPRGDFNSDRVMSHFVDAVGEVAPGASGAPYSVREGGRTVIAAFQEAGALSFAAITVLLLLVLRRVRDVAITMAPILLTGLLTMGSCVVLGQPLNFANIIALPLLFGIGVAFHIYFVMSWRSGGSHLLTSSLARGVFFSALTTATGFGSLWLSSHPGTASMGKLLMISLLWTLVSALIFQPALMGEPRAARG
jgi:hopanoid biosynthesis associated RND transporter like protein HpnN